MNATSADIMTILANSASGLVKGTNLFAGKEPDSPHRCVTVYDRPGNTPDAGGNIIKNPGIMVKIRGNKNAYTNGYALAEIVFNQLHAYKNTTVGGTDYLLVWAIGDINFISYDENSRPQWTINFRVKRT